VDDALVVRGKKYRANGVHGKQAAPQYVFVQRAIYSFS